MTLSETRKVAKGRVWTGEDALQHGLVDQLGGLADAVHLAKQQAGLSQVIPLQHCIVITCLQFVGHNLSGNGTAKASSWHGSEADNCQACNVLCDCLQGNIRAALHTAAMPGQPGIILERKEKKRKVYAFQRSCREPPEAAAQGMTLGFSLN